MNIDSEIMRLNFEDFLWVVFMILAGLNIYGDYDDKEYLRSNVISYKEKSNSIFTLTLTITFFIYFYFLFRNYKNYVSVPDYVKSLYFIRLLGSFFWLLVFVVFYIFKRTLNSFEFFCCQFIVSNFVSFLDYFCIVLYPNNRECDTNDLSFY